MQNQTSQENTWLSVRSKYAAKNVTCPKSGTSFETGNGFSPLLIQDTTQNQASTIHERGQCRQKEDEGEYFYHFNIQMKLIT